MEMFTTETGSIYRIDMVKKRICRCYGETAPTRRFGIDGEWKEFLSANTPEVGKSVVVAWRVIQQDASIHDASSELTVQMTSTSLVTKVEKNV